MYCANWANINKAASFNLMLSETTHWNMKGRSSGQPPIGRIDEASSEIVSHSFFVMDLTDSWWIDSNRMDLIADWLAGDRAEKMTESGFWAVGEVRSLRRRTADMARDSELGEE